MSTADRAAAEENRPPKSKGFRRIPPDRYRVLELRTWRLVQGCSGEAVKLFLALWAGPHSTRHGILFFPRDYLLVDLQWTRDQLDRAWQELEAADLLWSDDDLTVVVPFLQSNPPANADVVTHWRQSITHLPESPLFERLYRRALAWISGDGLTWLLSKISTVSPTVSTPSEHRVDTQPTLRNQEAGSSIQGAGSRTQEEGVRGQGDDGGQGGQGKEPEAALRSASPREAASLRAAPTQDEHGAGGDGAGRSRQEQLVWWLRNGEGTPAERIRLARRAYSEQEIQAAMGELSPEGLPVDGNGRCAATTRAGLECGMRPVAGSTYCQVHSEARHRRQT